VQRFLPVLLVVLLAGCGSGGGKSGSGETTTTSTTTSTMTSAGPVHCTSATATPAFRKLSNQHLKLDPAKTYKLVFDTSCGTFVVTLNQKWAPNAAGSLVSLAKRNFFDNTFFHRIVPGFVIQGGDPLGTGGGGPGYHVDEAPPPNLAYTKGTVAMAKTEVDPPGRSGSQFYVVTAADAGLPPEYALVGKVSMGYDVVEKIEALGDPNTSEGPPTQPVLIEKMTIEKG
jgi:cyclophilin family peptidyl-prolyl cis-trans isomerase